MRALAAKPKSPVADAAAMPLLSRHGTAGTALQIQRKLSVGATNDPLEHEADRIAEQVMRMPDAAAGSRAALTSGTPITTVLAKSAQHDGSDSFAAPPVVHAVLNSAGKALDGGTRAFMERRFSRDFSQVRVHTDEKAAQSAAAINASAYTVGQNIAFGEGQYQPQTPSGRTLLAHELTHVVQQSGANLILPGQVRQQPTTARPGLSTGILQTKIEKQDGPRLSHEARLKLETEFKDNIFLYVPKYLYALREVSSDENGKIDTDLAFALALFEIAFIVVSPALGTAVAALANRISNIASDKAFFFAIKMIENEKPIIAGAKTAGTATIKTMYGSGAKKAEASRFTDTLADSITVTAKAMIEMSTTWTDAVLAKMTLSFDPSYNKTDEIYSNLKNLIDRFHEQVEPIGRKGKVAGAFLDFTGLETKTSLAWIKANSATVLALVTETQRHQGEDANLKFERFVDEDLKSAALAKANLIAPEDQIPSVPASIVKNMPSIIPRSAARR